MRSDGRQARLRMSGKGEADSKSLKPFRRVSISIPKHIFAKKKGGAKRFCTSEGKVFPTGTNPYHERGKALLKGLGGNGAGGKNRHIGLRKRVSKKRVPGAGKS